MTSEHWREHSTETNTTRTAFCHRHSVGIQKRISNSELKIHMTAVLPIRSRRKTHISLNLTHLDMGNFYFQNGFCWLTQASPYWAQSVWLINMCITPWICGESLRNQIVKEYERERARIILADERNKFESQHFFNEKKCKIEVMTAMTAHCFSEFYCMKWNKNSPSPKLNIYNIE